MYFWGNLLYFMSFLFFITHVVAFRPTRPPLKDGEKGPNGMTLGIGALLILGAVLMTNLDRIWVLLGPVFLALALRGATQVIGYAKKQKKFESLFALFGFTIPTLIGAVIFFSLPFIWWMIFILTPLALAYVGYLYINIQPTIDKAKREAAQAAAQAAQQVQAQQPQAQPLQGQQSGNSNTLAQTAAQLMQQAANETDPNQRQALFNLAQQALNQAQQVPVQQNRQQVPQQQNAQQPRQQGGQQQQNRQQNRNRFGGQRRPPQQQAP